MINIDFEVFLGFEIGFTQIVNLDKQIACEHYVEELHKNIALYVYGKCGSLSSLKYNNTCNKIIGSYNFYLTFKKSLCKVCIID